MSSPAPSQTPEHAPPAVSSPNIRRSFTLPARIALKPAPNTNSADGIETLFICSNSKIFSFTAARPTSTRRQSPSRSARREHDPSRSIAWRTPTERTLAVGVLRIYRVTASNVSFLNSGHLLHTIFPRSQCWCVDNQSVFVLRIRQDSYYRMELPYETEEDKQSISQLKSVLRQVLQYEKTQCPFARGFEVEEPDLPKTPPRRPLSRQPTQKAKKWLFDKNWVPDKGPRPSATLLEGSDCGTTSSYEEDDRSSIHTDSSDVVLESSDTVFPTLPKSPPRRLSVAERASVFGMISLTASKGHERAASMSSMRRIPESTLAEEKPREAEKPILERHVSEANSLASSADSFYSVETSTHSIPSPAFLDPEADLLNPWAESLPKQEDVLRGRSTHRRQMSEITVRAPSVLHPEASVPKTPTAPVYSATTPTTNARPSSAPPTPPLISDSDDDSVELPALDLPTPPVAIRMKRLTGASQRRAFSPMPPAQNLFCPPKRKPGRDFTNALVRRTCELVLGPPANLVSLMLRIAQSISNGFGFSTYRLRRTEKPPCTYESDEEPEWLQEDDFGIPLTNIGDHVRRRRDCSGGVD